MSIAAKIAINAIIGGTAEKLGGHTAAGSVNGKFANGAVTGAYVMMFNHLSPKIIDVEKFQKKYFGHVEGLNKIHTGEIPEGYTLDEENRYFLNGDGKDVGGVTVYLGEGLSDVYLSPYAMKDAFNLYEVLGHEMIHVAHRNHFLDDYVKGASEYAAYKWNFGVGPSLFVGYPTVFTEVIPRKYLHSGLKAYKYENFDFTTSVPRSLWDW